MLSIKKEKPFRFIKAYPYLIEVNIFLLFNKTLFSPKGVKFSTFVNISYYRYFFEKPLLVSIYLLYD